MSTDPKLLNVDRPEFDRVMDAHGCAFLILLVLALVACVTGRGVRR